MSVRNNKRVSAKEGGRLRDKERLDGVEGGYIRI